MLNFPNFTKVGSPRRSKIYMYYFLNESKACLKVQYIEKLKS